MQKSMKIIILLLLSILTLSFTPPEQSPLITTKWYLKCNHNVLPHTSKIIHLYKSKPGRSCENFWDFKVNNDIYITASHEGRSIVHQYTYDFRPSEKLMVIDGESFRISKINEDEIVLILKS